MHLCLLGYTGHFRTVSRCTDFPHLAWFLPPQRWSLSSIVSETEQKRSARLWGGGSQLFLVVHSEQGDKTISVILSEKEKIDAVIWS